MSLPLQEWYMIPPEADIFWGMAVELGFVLVDVEPIKTVDMMEALRNRKTYGFLVCKPNSDRSSSFISEKERQDSRNIAILMEEYDNMSPTTAFLSILLNSGAEIARKSRERFTFFRERPPEVRTIPLQEDRVFNTVQNRFGNPGAADYHYVAYIFNNNSIWEIDNKSESCRRKAHCFKRNWINTMVELFEALELQSKPNLTFFAVAQEYKLDIWKGQNLINDILHGHMTDARVIRLGEEPVVDDDLADWEFALKEDYSALRRYNYDRSMALEIFRLNREVFNLHLDESRVDETEENVHENEFNDQYRSVQRPELYSLYAHIVQTETGTPELSSEESSTDQTEND